MSAKTKCPGKLRNIDLEITDIDEHSENASMSPVGLDAYVSIQLTMNRFLEHDSLEVIGNKIIQQLKKLDAEVFSEAAIEVGRVK